VASVLSLLGEHREGPCHSLLVAACLGAGVALLHGVWGWWPVWAGLALGAGLCSHVLIDMLNRTGVAAFWPWPFLLGLHLFEVGGPVEVWVIRPVCFLAAGALAWVQFRHGVHGVHWHG